MSGFPRFVATGSIAAFLMRVQCWRSRRRPRLIFVCLLSAGAAAGIPAAAQVDVALIASTEGAGAELGVAAGGSLRARFGFAGLEISDELRAGDIEYDGTADFRWGSAVFDWSPGGGAFHLSIGAMYNDHEIVGTADVLELAIDEFGQAEVDRVLALLPPDLDLGFLRAKAEFDSLSPYAGFGWRSSKPSGVGLSFDLGAIYLGEADATVTLQTELPIDLIPTGTLLLEEFLEEQEREIEAEAEDYQIYPVVRFAIFYRF